MQITIQSLTCSLPTDVFVFSKLYLMLQLSDRCNKIQDSTFACLPTVRYSFVVMIQDRWTQKTVRKAPVQLIQFPFISCSFHYIITQNSLFLQNICIEEDKIIIGKDLAFFSSFKYQVKPLENKRLQNKRIFDRLHSTQQQIVVGQLDCHQMWPCPRGRRATAPVKIHM